MGVCVCNKQSANNADSGSMKYHSKSKLGFTQG